MKRAWTVNDLTGDTRTDLAVVVEENAEDALEALRKALQDGDKYWTYIVKDEMIYRFAPGEGYNGEEWNCEDLNPDMWDETVSDDEYELIELPCYVNGEEHRADDLADKVLNDCPNGKNCTPVVIPTQYDEDNEPIGYECAGYIE